MKNLPAVHETWVQSLGGEGPLEKGIATHSSILAQRILWTVEPGGLQSMWLQRVGHDWASNTFIGKSTYSFFPIVYDQPHLFQTLSSFIFHCSSLIHSNPAKPTWINFFDFLVSSFPHILLKMTSFPFLILNTSNSLRLFSKATTFMKKSHFPMLQKFLTSLKF